MLDGVDGLEEVLAGDLAEDGAFVMTLDCDLLAGVLLDEDLAADDAGFLLAAAVLAGVFAGVLVVVDDLFEVGGDLVGDLESESEAAVKLNSLMGDTDDRLVADRDFLVEALDRLLVDGRFLLVDEELGLFLLGVGVLAIDDLGLGVPLMGLAEAFLAGVGVCLAILGKGVCVCLCVVDVESVKMRAIKIYI